ncbi:MAG: 50S ribosomal protein L25/general stress protein Ctc [Gammaproteobacteria bacterium]|nr:50S ribosomal protein L25/general stress protein Ctc [Gammaproteobacteria bacterium]MDH5305111.1 50S ribosomal protein L25/general stress protein Ctc [Gammaproteobacteria bacterium]
MAEKFDLVAEFREGKGKGASRRLRHEGKVPAILYGGGREPRTLAFDLNKLMQQMQSESFYSSILNIKVGSVSQAAIVKDVQRHPVRNVVTHIDLQRIVADQEIRMHVPIHFINEDIAVGVKVGGGSISHLRTDVEVVCLPKYLPEYFEVDIANLGVDQMLHLSDIKLPEGVAIPELAQGPEHNHPIVAIHVIKAAAIEEETAAVVAAEVPVVSDDKDKDKDKDA